MKKYSLYIFSRTVAVFLGLIAILISLIWFAKAISFVKFVTENGIGIDQFLSLFVLILPWLLLFIIPISLFCAILISYNKLIQSNEITVLKVAGLTKFAIAKPITLLAVICSLLSLLISCYLMPYANKKLRMERINFRNNYTNLMFNPGAFENLKNLTIYVKTSDKGKLSGILLHDKRSESYSLTITAKSGDVVIKESSALLYMENGSVQKFNYKDNSSEILYFDNYTFNLSENQGEESAITWKARERYLNELINVKGQFSVEELQKFTAEFHRRLTYPLFSVILSIIAISSILHGQFNRRGNFSNIVRAIILATSFMIITIILYNLMEIKWYYIPILYLNFILFASFGIAMLKLNYRGK